MARVAVISDIHVTDENREEAFRKLEETVKHIKEEEPELTVVLGDMIGGKVSNGKQVEEEDEGLEEILLIKEKMEEIGSEIVYLLGNHEQDIEKNEFSEKFDQRP